MLAQRLLPLALFALLLAVQASLWFGRGSIPDVMAKREALAAQQAANEAARQRNARLLADLQDFKTGTEMVEEKARLELGMIRPGEVLVQLTAAR